MFTKRQLKIELWKQLGRALAFIVISSTVIYILSGQINEISHRAKENRTAVAILEQKSQIATELKSNLDSIGDGDKKIEEAFIKADNIIEFINRLEKIAEVNDLEQTLRFADPISLNEQIPENEKDTAATMLKLLKVEYDINLKGNAQDFNNYLKAFEKLPYFTNISSITATASPTIGWEEQAAISIKAQLYITQ